MALSQLTSVTAVPLTNRVLGDFIPPTSQIKLIKTPNYRIAPVSESIQFKTLPDTQNPNTSSNPVTSPSNTPLLVPHVGWSLLLQEEPINTTFTTNVLPHA